MINIVIIFVSPLFVLIVIIGCCRERPVYENENNSPMVFIRQVLGFVFLVDLFPRLNLDPWICLCGPQAQLKMIIRAYDELSLCLICR